VEVDRPEIAEQKSDILAVFPKTKTLVGFVLRMNRENVRTPARSIANLEFHHTTDEVNDVGHRIVAALAAASSETAIRYHGQTPSPAAFALGLKCLVA